MPYRSQEDPDSRKFRNDCGPACVAMYLQWKGIYKTINELSAQTGLAGTDTGLTCLQLAALYSRNSSPARSVRINMRQIRERIDSGKPTTMLIRYGEIPERQSEFPGGHFVNVVGYIGNHTILINDPDRWDAGRFKREMGKNFSVPVEAFQRAIDYYGGQGVVVG